MLKLSDYIDKTYLYFTVAGALFISTFFIMYAVKDVVREKNKAVH